MWNQCSVYARLVNMVLKDIFRYRADIVLLLSDGRASDHSTPAQCSASALQRRRSSSLYPLSPAELFCRLDSPQEIFSPRQETCTPMGLSTVMMSPALTRIVALVTLRSSGAAGTAQISFPGIPSEIVGNGSA